MSRPFRSLAAFLACSLLFIAPSVADEAVPGHAVLAEPGGDALVIWDASKVVAMIVRSKMTGNEADGLLERDAVRVLAKMLPNIDRTAKTVTVRIIYAKTGEVSPVYGTPTFKGVERYATVVASARDLAAASRSWTQLRAGDGIPAWVTYKVIGRLPPRI